MAPPGAPSGYGCHIAESPNSAYDCEWPDEAAAFMPLRKAESIGRPIGDADRIEALEVARK